MRAPPWLKASGIIVPQITANIAPPPEIFFFKKIKIKTYQQIRIIKSRKHVKMIYPNPRVSDAQGTTQNQPSLQQRHNNIYIYRRKEKNERKGRKEITSTKTRTKGSKRHQRHPNVKNKSFGMTLVKAKKIRYNKT